MALVLKVCVHIQKATHIISLSKHLLRVKLVLKFRWWVLMQTLNMSFEVACLSKGAVAVLAGVRSVSIMLPEMVSEIA